MASLVVSDRAMPLDNKINLETREDFKSFGFELASLQNTDKIIDSHPVLEFEGLGNIDLGVTTLAHLAGESFLAVTGA